MDEIRIKKRVIGRLPKCYSIAPLTWSGRSYFLVAAEKKDPCYLFDLEGNQADTVWEGPGGVMSMVQVPGSDGVFLATRKFYSPNDGADAEIAVARPGKKGGWETHCLVKLPFVHRFDILQRGEEMYLIACTLKSAHAYKDDWRSPGKVYGVRLPEELLVPGAHRRLKLKVIKDGMRKNHGYCRTKEEGGQAAVISCEDGIYEFIPPCRDGDWEVGRLSEMSASDAVFVDLDGDGERELGVIAPFHGDRVSILKRIEGEYREVYRYPEPAKFAHAIYGGSFCGREAFLFGHREGKMGLAAVFYNRERQKYEEIMIDSGRGPANIYCYEREGKSCLVAANRETDEIALYEAEIGSQ